MGPAPTVEMDGLANCVVDAAVVGDVFRSGSLTAYSVA